MRSKMTIGGHPLHPMLVPIPIGLFVWAFVADLIYLWGGRDAVWYDISFWSDIAGLVAGAVAALPGIVDYLTVVPRTDARGIANGHMALNGVVLALFGVAALWMRGGGAREGSDLAFVIALHGAGVAVLAVSGWLGGEMVYRKHIAVVPDDEAHARAEAERHRRPLASEGQPHIARPLKERT